MGKSPSYRLIMSEAGYKALKAEVKTQRRPMADIMREALEQYFRQRGQAVSFEVERGGWREPADKE